MKINFNPFILLCGLLQICGGIYYFCRGDKPMSILYILYGFTNFVILFVRGV